jgi:alpha-D-ribose 1-methylphosphonate 5-triphosphate synthase subunit PhnH
MAKMTAAGLENTIKFAAGWWSTPVDFTDLLLCLYTTGPDATATTDVELTGYTPVALGSLSGFSGVGTYPDVSITVVYDVVFDPMPACTLTGWGIKTNEATPQVFWYQAYAATFAAGDRLTFQSGNIILRLHAV